MGCRCAERAQAMRNATSAIVRGDIKTVAREAAFVGRTLVDDTRTGALRRAAQTQLTRMRAGARR